MTETRTAANSRQAPPRDTLPDAWDQGDPDSGLPDGLPVQETDDDLHLYAEGWNVIGLLATLAIVTVVVVLLLIWML